MTASLELNFCNCRRATYDRKRFPRPKGVYRYQSKQIVEKTPVQATRNYFPFARHSGPNQPKRGIFVEADILPKVSHGVMRRQTAGLSGPLLVGGFFEEH